MQVRVAPGEAAGELHSLSLAPRLLNPPCSLCDCFAFAGHAYPDPHEAARRPGLLLSCEPFTGRSFSCTGPIEPIYSHNG